MIKPVIINCQKLPFEKTLGVASYILNLSKALSKHCKIIFAVPNLETFFKTEASHIISDFANSVVEINEIRDSEFAKNCIELLPHHFQESLFGGKCIQICHDFHVYDIAWKYGSAAGRVQGELKQNMIHADAVMCYFPRTYYEMESILGITKKALFLTESPLLFDPRGSSRKPEKGQVTTLLYPAQFQQHKNHKRLIQGLSLVVEKNKAVKILCTGTPFHENFMNELRDEIKQNGVEEYFDILGHVTDSQLRDLYAICDGLIIPSMAEGGAYVALEGIAAGKPVAVNDIATARLHLRSFNAKAHWFDAMEAAEVAEAITTLSEANSQDWFEANKTARKRIDDVSWDMVADKWVTVLNWLSHGGEKPRVYADKDGMNIEVR